MVSRKALGFGLTAAGLAFVAALVVLSMYGGSDNYTPHTDDPVVVFQEACARCHGPGGRGGDGIGPRLAGSGESREEVMEHVREGKGRMPRFPNIQGRVLERLADHVHGL